MSRTQKDHDSTYFLDNQTCDEAGATVLNKRGKWFCKIGGSAVVK